MEVKKIAASYMQLNFDGNNVFCESEIHLDCAERVSRLCLSPDGVDDADEILASTGLRFEALQQRTALRHQVVVASLV